MEEKKTFIERKKEIETKYADVIGCIARANNVDLGVAYDMLVANVIRGANYPYLKVEEFKADHEDLLNNTRD